MAEEVSLLDFWPSPFGMRVRIALNLKGIKYEYKEENLIERKSPLLVESNPVYKKVPVLIHEGRPICESLVILQYIDVVWKDRFPLIPTDLYHQAQARFWADFVEKKLYDCEKKIWMNKGEEQEKAKVEFVESLKLLEEQLGEKPYFGGETIGYLDVTLVAHYSWFYAYEKYGNFSITAECPRLVQSAKKCMKIDSVGKSLADEEKIYELVMAVKKKMDLE
ncbi:hypothetical protein DITRI_Ditri19aG0067300 [Diplodiscus trichospermus]